MTFSIKAIIRALLAPDHRLSCRSSLWKKIVGELERRGRHKHEAGAFLLGVENRGRYEITDAVFYDDLDSHAYDLGVCVLHGDAFAKLWELCRQKNLTVIGDVHTHPGAANQSQTDKVNPMIARTGHIAIIIPNYAAHPVNSGSLGIYEYRGNHEWIRRSAKGTGGFLYTGFWS